MSRKDGEWGRFILEYMTIRGLRERLAEAIKQEDSAAKFDPASRKLWQRRVRRIERVMRDRGVGVWSSP